MSKERSKGTAFESLLLEAFQAYIPDAHRLGQQGEKDQGDIWLPRGKRYVVEAKHCARLELAGWAAEAKREADNAAKPFWIVAHKRKGTTNPFRQWVTTDLYTWLELTKND